MKKILALALALLMVLALAACGGTTDPAPSGSGTQQTDPGTSQQGDNDTKPNNNTDDLTTVSGFLTAFGLTENDMKCAKFTRLDRTSYVLETNQITEVGTYISEKLTDEEVKEWLEQIIGKLNSLSADGKIANSHADANGEALTADFMMSQSMIIGGGSYNYKGKTVGVVISVAPRSLDNEDPDEAMPACTLELKWR